MSKGHFGNIEKKFSGTHFLISPKRGGDSESSQYLLAPSLASSDLSPLLPPSLLLSLENHAKGEARERGRDKERIEFKRVKSEENYFSGSRFSVCVSVLLLRVPKIKPTTQVFLYSFQQDDLPE